MSAAYGQLLQNGAGGQGAVVRGVGHNGHKSGTLQGILGIMEGHAFYVGHFNAFAVVGIVFQKVPKPDNNSNGHQSHGKEVSPNEGTEYFLVEFFECHFFYDVLSVICLKDTQKNKKEVKLPLLLLCFSHFLQLLAMLLVRNGQLLASLSATRCQYATAIGSGHSFTETVLVLAATVVGLKCSFHIFIFFLLLFQS